MAKSKTEKTPAAAKGPAKQNVVVALLRRQQGASIEEIMDATNWQAHSVRGWMSGAAKKRLGLELISEKDPSGTRRYYIAAVKPSA